MFYFIWTVKWLVTKINYKNKISEKPVEQEK